MPVVNPDSNTTSIFYYQETKGEINFETIKKNNLKQFKKRSKKVKVLAIVTTTPQ